jgi:integrase
MTKRLSPKGIENAAAGPIRKEVPDGLLVGFYLVVQPSGAKSFAVRYRHAGQPRKLTLGQYPKLDLAKARELGSKALRAAAEGRDPASEKQSAKTEAEKAKADRDRGKRDLFENVAAEFIRRYAIKNNRETTWRETARILGASLPTDALKPQKWKTKRTAITVMSAWRGRKIADISKRDVNALLNRVADTAPIMANRMLAAISKLFNWCVSQGIVETSPCVLVARPSPERTRDRVLSNHEIKLIWNAAEREGPPYGALIKLLLLTGQRLSEVGGMRWSELDLENKLWTLPPARVKNNERHLVPLADTVMEIIDALPRIKTSEGFVFTTTRNAAVSGFSRCKDRLDAAVASALPEGETAPEHWTFHDLRRTAATGMARLGVSLQVVEKILNHSSGSFSGVAGIYNRHGYESERRAALNVWAEHVNAIVTGDHQANVVSLAARRP